MARPLPHHNGSLVLAPSQNGILQGLGHIYGMHIYTRRKYLHVLYTPALALVIRQVVEREAD